MQGERGEDTRGVRFKGKRTLPLDLLMARV